MVAVAMADQTAAKTAGHHVAANDAEREAAVNQQWWQGAAFDEVRAPC